MYIFRVLTRSSAVAAIADRAAHNARYSYRPLAGIALVNIGSYFSFEAEVCFDAGSLRVKYTYHMSHFDACQLVSRSLFIVVGKRYIIQQKCLKK